MRQRGESIPALSRALALNLLPDLNLHPTLSLLWERSSTRQSKIERPPARKEGFSGAAIGLAGHSRGTSALR